MIRAQRRWFMGLAGLACFAFALLDHAGTARARQNPELQWIWYNEGDPTKEAPPETRYFRSVFTINRDVQKPVDEATLDITADNAFIVWVNGTQVGKGNDWKRVYQFDVQRQLVHGKNVIAVEAKNTEGPAGLLVRLRYVPNGLSKIERASDGSWKAFKTMVPGWETVNFDDRSWLPVKVLGAYGKAGPWRGLVWDAGGGERFSVPPGFHVDMVVPANPNPRYLDPRLPFSLINMTFDAKGRLFISQERGPVLLCTNPDSNGVLQTVKPYCSQVKNCHGMCWVKDALLLVGDGPGGTGLYRVRDTQGVDQTDQVELLHKFKGGMGEHGPHAILHGPDGWLYLVIGNHGWAQPGELASNSPLRRWPSGGMGPDQGKQGSTEDVLLPRLNDARGHAANILAPGGTIWRFDQDGKNMSLVAAGFRNAFDAAFSPSGELFTFDSDMEWDENLPWYRAVRVCHCPPGADFVWRTGSANTPDYYIDSLPPVLETGRGSPVGMEFYEHDVFPEKYRGALFMGDWSLGIIWAVHFERTGATYKGKAEKFCQGAPMNVTDLAVGPDGAIYFVMGGRGSQGGVYRIVHQSATSALAKPVTAKSQVGGSQTSVVIGPSVPAEEQSKIIAVLAKQAPSSSLIKLLIKSLIRDQTHGTMPEAKLLLDLLNHAEPEVRALAVWLLGVNGYKEGRDPVIKCLRDDDALVRRRACEALIRAGFEPPLDSLWPLLGDQDRFVRTAARLVLQRVEPTKWADRLWKESKDGVALEGIIALSKTNQAAPYEGQIFSRLLATKAAKDRTTNIHLSETSNGVLLDYLRTLQMALVHTKQRPPSVKSLAEHCFALFPVKDCRVNRELAILLTYLRKEALIVKPVHSRLLAALNASKDDRLQQIHYFYCLRFLPDGWTADEKRALAAWYDSTKTWQGGHSFTPFLENIFREVLAAYDIADRKELLRAGEQYPLVSLVLAQRLQNDQQSELLPELSALAERFGRQKIAYRAQELQQAIENALSKTALSHPTLESWPYLVRGLDSTNPVVLTDVVEALRKSAAKPKSEDPAPYRALLLASRRLSERNRWSVVELLRHWSNDRQFGADPGDWKTELTAWSRWFGQSFPKESALPDVAGDKPAESKYKFDVLLAFLEKDPAGRNGDVVRGRAVFEKAQCFKCHKVGKDGEGIGPDLTTVSKRFKRFDILESIIYPSKVISDQYRSTMIVTKKGQQINGLVAPQGDMVSVSLSDGTRITLKSDEIEQRFASLTSIMPERLLDPLTKQEIADLFAFMESEPK